MCVGGGRSLASGNQTMFFFRVYSDACVRTYTSTMGLMFRYKNSKTSRGIPFDFYQTFVVHFTHSLTKIWKNAVILGSNSKYPSQVSLSPTTVERCPPSRRPARVAAEPAAAATWRPRRV